jgi:hypothetical protein
LDYLSVPVTGRASRAYEWPKDSNDNVTNMQLYPRFDTHDRHAALQNRYLRQRQANTRTVSDDAEAQILDPKIVMGYLASRPSVLRAAIHINVIIHY